MRINVICLPEQGGRCLSENKPSARRGDMRTEQSQSKTGSAMQNPYSTAID